jgi:hypothetical protein
MGNKENFYLTKKSVDIKKMRYQAFINGFSYLSGQNPSKVVW